MQTAPRSGAGGDDFPVRPPVISLERPFEAPPAGAKKGDFMGQPVIHFEVIGKDGEKLRSYYSELFDWKIDADNPMNYGMVARDDNVNSEGIGIGGGVGGPGPDDYEGHVTFYVEVPDVEASLAKAESLGGSRIFGPDEVMDGLVLGQFADCRGPIGLVQGRLESLIAQTLSPASGGVPAELEEPQMPRSRRTPGFCKPSCTKTGSGKSAGFARTPIWLPFGASPSSSRLSSVAASSVTAPTRR